MELRAWRRGRWEGGSRGGGWGGVGCARWGGDRSGVHRGMSASGCVFPGGRLVMGRLRRRQASWWCGAGGAVLRVWTTEGGGVAEERKGRAGGEGLTWPPRSVAGGCVRRLVWVGPHLGGREAEVGGGGGRREWRGAVVGCRGWMGVCTRPVAGRRCGCGGSHGEGGPPGVGGNAPLPPGTEEPVMGSRMRALPLCLFSLAVARCRLSRARAPPPPPLRPRPRRPPCNGVARVTLMYLCVFFCFFPRAPRLQGLWMVGAPRTSHPEPLTRALPGWAGAAIPQRAPPGGRPRRSGEPSRGGRRRAFGWRCRTVPRWRVAFGMKKREDRNQRHHFSFTKATSVHVLYTTHRGIAARSHRHHQPEGSRVSRPAVPPAGAYKDEKEKN